MANASNATIQPYREGAYGTQRLFGKEWTFCDFAEKDGTQPNACPALTQVRRWVVSRAHVHAVRLCYVLCGCCCLPRS